MFILKIFLNLYVDGPTREGAKLNLLLRIRARVVTEPGKHPGTCDHHSICFKIPVKKDRTDPQVQYYMINIYGFGREFAKVDWGDCR